MEFEEMREAIFQLDIKFKRLRWSRLYKVMTATEFKMLGLLMKHRELHPEQTGIYASVIAEALRISRPAVSRQLQQMESRGWIRRVTDPDSKRNVFVQLLPEGEESFTRQREDVDRFWQSVCRGEDKESIERIINDVAHVMESVDRELQNIEKQQRSEHE